MTILRLLALAALPLLAACGDAAEESDDPAVGSDIVTPLPPDAQTVGAGVTAPVQPAIGDDAAEIDTAEQVTEDQ